ncbi:hypothetical protein [Paracidovorax konjaci]|uniref:Uncharacterized protein n=1 Tax=Paracidovorax konjaci TaxID=32040 RepID=A0A1I1W294_9BURK|nr:hypothetical protein [Paracidovorax konjaci]SFD89129.1 hypothetical protein SAMN04489710_10846 [Paracidovorax konjaci]
MPDLFFALTPFVLGTFLPLLGMALTAALLVYGLYARAIDLPYKWRLNGRALIALCVLAALCDAWIAARLYLAHRARQAWEDSAPVRASRERFVLPQDFRYGELSLPAGSLVNRRDPFDKGEPSRPLALHGLEAVRFAQPVQVAGVWASALDVLATRVELAQDQRIGPLHRYDAANQRWAVNPVVPALACRRGQVAVFHAPHIPYDLQAELGRPPPDGPSARFLPSQWLFLRCESGPPVEVQPAAAAPGVSG